MKELKVKKVSGTPGFLDDMKVYAFELEPGDTSEKIDEYIERKYGHKDGITQEQFHQLLDKASQPIEKPESDQAQS